MNILNWFEIPVRDMDRAVKFYNAILGADLEAMDMGESQMAMLPMEGEGVSGALTKADGFTPGNDGPLIYLNGGADLNTALSKIEGAGGQVLVPKTSIGEHGFYALFADTEGNRLGLHSMG